MEDQEKLLIILLYVCVGGLALAFLFWLLVRRKAQVRKQNEDMVRMKWAQLDDRLVNPMNMVQEEADGGTTLDLPGSSAAISLTYMKDGKIEKKTFPTEVSIKIGRGAENDICIENPTVSRGHCEIYGVRGGGFSVCDMNSQNKTIVRRNGRKTVVDGTDDAFIIQSGDCLLLGTTEIWIDIKAD